MRAKKDIKSPGFTGGGRNRGYHILAAHIHLILGIFDVKDWIYGSHRSGPISQRGYERNKWNLEKERSKTVSIHRNNMATSNEPNGRSENPNIYLIRTNYNSRIDSVLLLSLKSILPLLLFATLLISGTLAISYTFFHYHKALPPHFVLGVSVTVGILAVVTAVFLLLLRVRRFNQRRSATDQDPEANPMQPIVRGARTPSSTKGHTRPPEHTRRVRSTSPESVVSGLGPRPPSAHCPPQNIARNPPILPYSHNPPPSREQAAFHFPRAGTRKGVKVIV